jgi:hypothetical protein
MRVYHFSDAQHALSNIALWRIKISRFSDLNDPFELLGADLSDKGKRKAFRLVKEKLNEDTGLLCFSKSWSNPVLWSHYADKHRGICLGFDIPTDHLHAVNYTLKPMSVITPKSSNTPRTTEDIIFELMRTKFIDWKYEDEMRLLIDIGNKPTEAGLHFKPFSKDLELKEIILGPRCELPISSIRNLAASYPYPIDVIKSRIAFTKFEVRINASATNRGK